MGMFDDLIPAKGGVPAAARTPGQLAPGNIDLAHRPVVRNRDGSISTVRSMSANFDGEEVLIPTVSDDGRIMTESEAIENYRRSGRHLGKFVSPEAATAYAQDLHSQQEKMYSGASATPQQPQGFAPKPLAGRGLFDDLIPATRADFSDVDQRSTAASTERLGRAPAQPPQRARTTGEKIKREVLGLGTRNVVEGAADVIGLVTDPVVNLVNYLGEKGSTPRSLITGVPERRWPVQQTTREAWTNWLNAAGVPQAENARERVSGDVGRALTGTALTLGLGGGLGAGRTAVQNPTIRSRTADLLTAQPVQQAIAAAGGAGAAGAARESGAGPGAQLLAGLGGGLAPAGAQAAGAATLRTLVRGTSGAPMQRTIADFNALNASPSVGQASNNRLIQGVENLLAGAPTSSGVMNRFAERQADSIGGGLQRTADDLSRNASAERAGRAVERGTDAFAGNTKAVKRALYWNADRFIPQATQVPLANTWQSIVKLTTPTPGAAATTGALINPRVQQLRQSLSQDLAGGGGQIPYEALKRIRSDIGEAISDFSLSPDTPTRELKQLYGALSRDMEAAARAQGPEAVKAAQRANNYTRAVADRMETVQRVIDKNGGPERVFEAAMSGTRDGGTTLRAVMQSLPKDGQKAVTAAVIKRMGLATPGAQDAAGDVFSAGTFLTNWNRVSPEAKRALFDRHGPAFSEHMDRIARVASNIKEGSKVYANPSGTANRAAALTYGGALVASLLDPSKAATGGLLLGGGVANATSRLLTKPWFVKWLAESTAMPVGAAVGQIQGLRRIGEREQDDDAIALADQLSLQENAVGQ